MGVVVAQPVGRGVTVAAWLSLVGLSGLVGLKATRFMLHPTLLPCMVLVMPATQHNPDTRQGAQAGCAVSLLGEGREGGAATVLRAAADLLRAALNDGPRPRCCRSALAA